VPQSIPNTRIGSKFIPAALFHAYLRKHPAIPDRCRGKRLLD
jgi:hypothetical protein